MPDLLQGAGPDSFPWLWTLAILAMLALGAAQAYLGRRLKTAEAPRRIVSLELAGTAGRSQRILDSWDQVPGARADATKGLYWDFGFLASYALVLSHGCSWAGRIAAERWDWPAAGRAGLILAWLAWFAALCDAGENLCLLRQLRTRVEPIWAGAARSLAVVKFALIVLALAGVAIGVTARWPYLAAHVKFAAFHPVLVLILVALYGIVYGLVGRGNGLPSLFWHDRFRARIAASCGATLLLLVMGVVVYYQHRDARPGLVEMVAGPEPWQGRPPTARENVDHLSRFLGWGGIPLLALLAAPALVPVLFPRVPRSPMKCGGLGFEATVKMKERAAHMGTAAGDWIERRVHAPRGSWRWFPARFWGSITWLLGMGLGIGITILFLSAGRLLHPDPDKPESGPLRPEVVFYVLFLLTYIIMANGPVYRWVSAAFAICAMIGLLVTLYAIASDLNELSLAGPDGQGWWISPSVLFLVGLAVLFGWANNSPYKLRFPNMEAYDADSVITGLPVVDPLCRAFLRWLGYDPAAGTRVQLRGAVARQYFSGGGPPTLPDDGAKLIDDETALRGWLDRVRLADGKLPKLAVVVVSGGATRSAYWTATVLERIEEILPEFSRHVRVIAGASGGMLGIGCYIKELRARLDPSGAPRRRSFPHTVPHDSIQEVARFIALRDAWRSLWPFRWHTDRGVVLENDWGLGIPITKLREQEERGEIPSAIHSPMIVDDGRRLLISNLDLWQLSGAEGGALAEDDAGMKTHDYSLSAVEFFRLFPLATGFTLATAIRMNASFPYVSPAVNLPCDPPRRIVDAGYYDNYGVQVASAWIRKNLYWILRNTSGIVLVQIRDWVSQMARLEVADAPTGLAATISRGFQFFSSPLDAATQARYTVCSFTNDQDVQNLSDLFTDRYLRVRLGIDPATATSAQTQEARAFFTTTVFENSAVVSYGGQPADYWPGDAPSGTIPLTEVALDWYLSAAERDGLDTAIPRLPDFDKVEPITSTTAPAQAPPPPGSNWMVAANRLSRIEWLRENVAATHNAERDRWLKELEQARNFERLVQLRQWWHR
jgi:hypothetical protein